MARKYALVGTGTVGTNKSIIGMTAAATIRPAIYDIVLGCAATPLDLAGRFAVARFTAAGTSTAVTPLALDPGNPASLAAGGSNHSAEPTYTAGGILLQFGLNQRATFRWVAAPGGELIAPATAANGIGLYSISHGGTPICEGTFHWEE
jgi:hypothetical protein